MFLNCFIRHLFCQPLHPPPPHVPLSHFFTSAVSKALRCITKGNLRAPHLSCLPPISPAFCSGAFLLGSHTTFDNCANFEVQGGGGVGRRRAVLIPQRTTTPDHAGWAPVETCSILLPHGVHPTWLLWVPASWSPGAHSMISCIPGTWTFFSVLLFPVPSHQYPKMNHPHENPCFSLCLLVDPRLKHASHFHGKSLLSF